jgi:molybdenum cofactor synthesis domain-containing protein
MSYKAGIVTLSDKGAAGEREDISGNVIREILKGAGIQVISYKLLADEKKDLQAELIRLCDEVQCDLILTTGGTGFSPRDVTPEATTAVADRMAPGIAEAIRAYSMTVTKRAMLSRGVSVIRKSTLIINLPGSPKAVKESLGYIMDTLFHGLDILKGQSGECARK